MKDALFKYRDMGYKEFHQKLMPTIAPSTVIGVRTPDVRRIAKEYFKSPVKEKFLCELPHKYYEENNLHAFFIAEIKDFESCIKEVEKFLPYIDNWATCDGLRPKCFSKNTDKLLLYIENWLKSEKTYTIRFGMEMLMLYFLDNLFREEYLEMVAGVESEEYYVQMMQAWYFATALSKQWDSTFPYIKEKRLSAWVHNKTIQKAVESYRITDEQKKLLRTFRR